MNGLLTSPMSNSGTTTATAGATNGTVGSHSTMMNSNNHHNGAANSDTEHLKKVSSSRGSKCWSQNFSMLNLLLTTWRPVCVF